MKYMGWNLNSIPKGWSQLIEANKAILIQASMKLKILNQNQKKN